MTRKAQKAKLTRRDEAHAFDIAVGARIQARRKAKSLLQSDLAEQIGLSGPQVSRYESGEFSCEPATLARIAKALGCKTSDLLDGIEVK